MITNQKMQDILNHQKYDRDVIFKTSSLSKLFDPPFVKRFDCIIISDKTINITKEQFENAVKMCTDKTGYEACNTETRINDFIENEDLDVHEIIPIALTVIYVWGNKLKNLYSKEQFCFTLSCSDNYVTLRFHQVRKDETMWLSDDLEGYDEAVGYVII